MLQTGVTSGGFAVVTASVVSGLGSLALAGYLLRHRGKPGANWFVLALLLQTVGCLSYGGGLVVAATGPRWVLELAMWIAVAWTGPLFLAFALDYTGRGDVIRRWPGVAVFGVASAVTGLVLTQGYHGLLWSGFEIAPVFGLSAVAYDIHALGYLAIALGLTIAGIGVLLLIETILSYGPLYRREAAAVSLSVVPPAVGIVAWSAGVGPYHPLSFAPALYLPHLALDAYAFVGTEMFERNPTTRRAAERTAIDDIPSPIVIADTDHRIVEVNDAATRTFGVAANDARGVPVGSVFGDAVVGAINSDEGGAPDAVTGAETDTESSPAADASRATDSGGEDRQVVPVETPERIRRFTLSSSPLLEPGGTHVGWTVVLQDVTEEVEREQRLDVLNRVIRHNLRNEMTVIMGHAEAIESALDDEEMEAWATALQASGRELVEIGEKARTFERLRSVDPVFEPTDLGSLVGAVVEEITAEYPDARVEADVAVDGRPRVDTELLQTVLANLLENAVEHASETEPRAWIRTHLEPAAESSSTAVRSVADGGSVDGSRREDGSGPGDGSGGDGCGDGSGDGGSGGGSGCDGSTAGTVVPDPAPSDPAPVGEGAGTVVFEVEDEGPGIPEQELAALEAGVERPLEHASGLGLWIVTWGVEALGGEVSFRASDRGTVARVELPVR